MHELSIAQSIVEIVQQHLPSDRIPVVKSVQMKVGHQAGIVPDSLEFCFGAVTEGTVAQGARLEIENVPGDELRVVSIELAD
jgi:hydrogenase nickel incorporation protein HypA/HybF